jgi:hypothetical protein
LLDVGSYSAKVIRSASDLRERAQTTNAHLEQVVLLRLRCERASEERLERQSFAKGCAEISLLFAEETGAKPAIGGEPHPVAASAIRV